MEMAQPNFPRRKEQHWHAKRVEMTEMDPRSDHKIRQDQRYISFLAATARVAGCSLSMSSVSTVGVIW